MLDKEFTAHAFLCWYSSLNTVSVVQVCAKIKLRCDLLGARDLCLLLSCFFCCDSFSWSSTASVVIYPNQVALRFVWKALGAVWACNEWLIHPVKITATSGYPLRDVQVCTGLLFSSFGRHWYKVALYSVQPEQGPPNLHQDALQFDWKALECYKFGEHNLLLLRRSRQDGEIKSCLAQKRASCESKSKTCGAQRTHH